MASNQEYIIDIVARDFASPTFDRVGKKSTTLADQLRLAGEVSDVNPLKKFGKFLGGTTDIAGVGGIGEQASQARSAALSEYGEAARKIVEVERSAIAIEKERAIAMADRRDAARKLGGELAQINAMEKEKLANSPRALRGDIRDDAEIDRAVVAKEYAATVAKSNALTAKADAADKSHAAAIIQKSQATADYAKKLQAIDAAEKEAIKNARAETLGLRMAAAAGATLLVVNAVGKLADGYDKANDKLKRGEITSAMFWAEWAKGVPIIGGVVTSVESLVTAVGKATGYIKDVTEEAARSQAVVDQRIIARKTISDTIDKYANVGKSDRQTVIDDAAKKLEEIAKAQGLAKGMPELEANLAAEQKAVIEKRDADLAKLSNDAYSKRLADRRKFDADLRSAVSEATAAEASLVSSRLRAQGKELEASLNDIRSKYAAQVGKIDADRQALRDEGNLNVADRVARQNALERQRDAVGGLQEAEVAAARREAAEKARKAAKDLQDQELDQDRAGVVQGRSLASAQDGRFSAGAAAARAQVEIMRDQTKHAASTAQNTKDSRDLLQRLYEAVAGGPALP